MAFQLEISAEAVRDFGLIFDHLLKSCISFGESVGNAVEKAGVRLLEMRAGAGSAGL